VAEFSWAARSPLEHVLVVGAYGARRTNPGVSLTEVRGFGLIQVMARRGRSADLANAVHALFGIAAPYRPKAAQAENATLIWSGPDQFLVLSPGDGDPPMDALRQAFSGLASLSDQSHARALIRVAGPDARAMLAKLSSIDLHPAAFPPGSAAATSIDHTSVNLWRDSDLPDGQAAFNLLVFATFAQSLWHTMLDAAAEYGVDVRPPQDGLP
jgi:heterotetrameric sarcosine oxidase gamma subunit